MINSQSLNLYPIAVPEPFAGGPKHPDRPFSVTISYPVLHNLHGPPSARIKEFLFVPVRTQKY